MRTRAESPGPIVAWQRHLIAGGAEVRLVRRGRNLARVLGELTDEGFDAYLPVTAASVAPGVGGAAPELRPLRERPAE